MAQELELFHIYINSMTGKKYEFKVSPLDTVLNIKVALDKDLKIPQTESILLFNEQELKDEDMMCEVGIMDGSNLFLAVKMIGGPLTMGNRIYSASVKNLRDTLEKTKNSLVKKYSKGCRVLILLYKDEANNHHFLRVYDENDHAKACKEDEEEEKRKKQEATVQKSTELSENDHLSVLEKLHEEMKMKMKVNDLRRKMKEVAEQKRLKKRKTTIEETKKASSYTSQLSMTEQDFYDRVLLVGQEFSYTCFMKAYYDERKYTADMLGHKNLLFRVVLPSVVEENVQPLLMASEKEALKEDNRSRSHYLMINRPCDDDRTRLLKEYERCKREEMETIAFGLRRSGLSIRQVESNLKRHVTPAETDATPTVTIEDLRTCVSRMNLDGGRPAARRRRERRRRSTPDRSVSPPPATPDEKFTKELESSNDESFKIKFTKELESSDDECLVIDTDEELNSSGLWTDLDDPDAPERVVIRELPPVVVENKASKCAVCKRRLNLMNRFHCRCGKLHCPQHRYAESHDCSFDYRKNGRETLTKQNPRIVGEKIKKI